jgi:DNA-binding FrmR family transcriptional regulator
MSKPARATGQQLHEPSEPETPELPAPQPSPQIHGYASEKETLIKRLHRIEGQVRGIERMLVEDRYCIDIITQISAVSTALESVAFRILDEHVKHCVAGALTAGEEEVAAAKTRELLEAVHRFARAR